MNQSLVQNLTLRRSNERGHARHGWLESFHTFSFADYFDPRFTGFRSLLVINEDRVQPGEGFGTHGHRDMEIISYVISGALAHKDSMGSGSVLRPGDVQHMSAGTGVRHSEFNHSEKELVHFLQIWIAPKGKGIRPKYQERNFGPEKKQDRLCLLVSPDGAENSLPIHQDVRLYASILSEGQSITHSVQPKRAAWIQIIQGSLDANGIELRTGDGASIEFTETLQMTSRETCEFLLFDLP
jgi:hypothetical protein